MAAANFPAPQGLYDPGNERDSCGIGFLASIKGRKTHKLVQDALVILENLTHRGATGFDPLLGDGAGILLQIPHKFFRQVFSGKLPEPSRYGVGMFFLPQEVKLQRELKALAEKLVALEGQNTLGWREVPVNTLGLSKAAIRKSPKIFQLFVEADAELENDLEFERKLYLIRKQIESFIGNSRSHKNAGSYVASFSSRTIVYKGMVLARQVGEFYDDLKNPSFESSLALVHQRFSTNTFPSWELSQPFRMTAHNGEINTVQGNINWMKARQGAVVSDIFGDDIEKVFPFIAEGQSDTASFDNALELLVLGGYSLAHAIMLLIPEAWEKNKLLSPTRKAFYKYHAPLMEPWDGPAAIVFTDGIQIGATLDRNGLRPSRFIVTKDDMVVMASEAGVLPVGEDKIKKKWRLEPGKMLLIDTEAKRIIDDDEIKDNMAALHDFSSYLKKQSVSLQSLPESSEKAEVLDVSLIRKIFGYTQEDMKFVLVPMATTGQESIGSMGNDSPPAVLSDKNKLLYNYFKQLFAQVTNPPIDPIREELVMSLMTFIGPKPNLFEVGALRSNKILESNHPFLDDNDFSRIKNIADFTDDQFRSSFLDITVSESSTNEDVENLLSDLCKQAERLIEAGTNILILSDAKAGVGRVPIPALLATSAVHHFLVRNGMRTKAGLVVQTGSARETHHFALLGGYGAEAVHPWLAIQSLHELSKTGSDSPEKLVDNYRKAVGKGLFKVMSKFGISTFRSYSGAQVFEAVGLSKEFTDKYFTGTSSKIDGIGLHQVIEESRRVYSQAIQESDLKRGLLDPGGEYAFRVRGEQHLWTSESVSKLQNAVRAKDEKSYREYSKLINNQSKKHMTFRGLFDIGTLGQSIPLEHVEPWTEIVKRFSTGAMSMGSISTEAHSTLAIAMNRLKGKSNTGEGGEDPMRFGTVKSKTDTTEVLGNVVVKKVTLQKGDSLRSRIKQVASGRFGVTAEYLSTADQIQIKIAQGAKPGEGGQLPGHKVSEYIAKLRFSVPGVGLISPPPHHDIYSIEDLAQLIHDLKNVNPKAAISVKLVSEVGVGTIAAGVAKCKADHITIAGYDGGTGASPLSSIKHAGTPWELGLAEAQQTLVLNQLRGRVTLQVDGQMKTGRDVVIGALLGADEFGFATAPLVAEGCIMMRKCHLNTCPVGVATQDEELRKKFSGKPEHVINYFYFVAEEIRMIMATMGARNLNEIIGRSDLLDMRKGIEHWKAIGLDFSKIFYRPEMPEEVARYNSENQDHGLGMALDNAILLKARKAIRSKQRITLNFNITNVNRTVGTMLSGEIAAKWGHKGLPEDTISVNFKGTAGQSFGAFLAKGVSFTLEGDANDYTGKGLCGGKIIIRPSNSFSGLAHENIIVGNTVLYGGIDGEVYFRGVAGERFCVRNSGVTAVVEGVGDHGCEYMTGGTVVVLGETGANFAAGMSGGIAYVLDEFSMLSRRVNPEMVTLEPVEILANQDKNQPWHLGQSDEVLLKDLIKKHYDYTESQQAYIILENWEKNLKKFVKVFPKEYKRALVEMNVKKGKQLEAA